MSFRTRLLVTSLATLIVGLGALLVAGNVLLRTRVRAEVSSVLRARAEAQIAGLQISAGSIRARNAPNDEELDRQSWIFAGTRVLDRPSGVSPAASALAGALAAGRRVAERDGPGDLRLRAEPVRAPGTGRVLGAVVVGISLVPFEHLERVVLLGSLVIALLVVFVAAVVLRRVLDGALRPVKLMTANAEDWSAHDLDSRFALGAPRDELTGLAATLDGLLARIAASRRHEQRFAADVAHELRTPIAVMRATAEVALVDGAHPRAKDGERHAALQTIVAQTERIGKTIDTLLSVARREITGPQEAVDLARIATEVDDVTLDAAPGLPLAEGDPEVVRRALAPLLDNARRHARTEVRLELAAADGTVRLTVRDDGDGVPAALGEHVFEPGVHGDGSGSGAGLGLALARRLARSCGGDVVLGPGPGGCFVLELPAAAGT